MGLKLTKTAAPSTPAANKAEIYVDTADRRVKAIDDNGVISMLNHVGAAENILANGDFRIQQRVLAASTAIPGVSTTTRAGQVADRWAVTCSVVTATSRWAQIDSAAAPETGLTSRYYGSLIADTAGRKFMISQFVINSEMAHLRGQKVRVSVKTNQKVGNAQSFKLGLLQLAAAGTVDVSPAFLTGAWSTVTGTDPAWGTNLLPITPDASPTGENGTITGNFLVITSQQTVWQRSSCVFTVPSNAKNIVVVLFSDATGGATDNLSLTEFQLTQGPDIIDYITAPFAVELIRCQQFFCKSFSLGTVPASNLGLTTGPIKWSAGVAGAVAGTWGRAQFPVNMWKVPTITLFNPAAANAQVRQIGATAGDCATSSGSQITTQSCDFTTTPGASAVVGTILGVHYTAEAEFIL